MESTFTQAEGNLDNIKESQFNSAVISKQPATEVHTKLLDTKKRRKEASNNKSREKKEMVRNKVNGNFTG